MADVRRLIARLNPSGARLDGAGGGKPELTNEDIAAALGMITNPNELGQSMVSELAREVFCAIWWPDGARLNRQQLLRLIHFRQAAELNAQLERLQRARLELHITLSDLASRQGRPTPNDLEVRRRLEKRLQYAKDQCWPANAEMYAAVRNAVINEIASPNHCRECGGRGELTGGSLVIRCNQCDGTGAKPVSDRQRALGIGKSAWSYSKDRWKNLYEWTYNLVRDAESEAIRALREVLK